jgi:uncharacterized membrane protein YdjX (TVP38/TMEM64 family)
VARLLLKPLLLTALLSLGVLTLHLGWWGPFTEEDLLRGLFLQHRTLAWPVFAACAIVFTALGGPRQVLAFSCGYLLGGWQGAVLGTLLTGLGALLTMATVRHLGMPWLRARHASRVAAVRHLLAQDTWLWICTVRLMPVGSNLATNIAAGLSGLPMASVFWGSLPGYLPQMLMFSYAGSGLALQDSSQLWISLAMLAGSSALGIYLYHNGFKQRLASWRGRSHAR